MAISLVIPSHNSRTGCSGFDNGYRYGDVDRSEAYRMWRVFSIFVLGVEQLSTRYVMRIKRGCRKNGNQQ